MGVESSELDGSNFAKVGGSSGHFSLRGALMELGVGSGPFEKNGVGRKEGNRPLKDAVGESDQVTGVAEAQVGTPLQSCSVRLPTQIHRRLPPTKAPATHEQHPRGPENDERDEVVEVRMHRQTVAAFAETLVAGHQGVRESQFGEGGVVLQINECGVHEASRKVHTQVLLPALLKLFRRLLDLIVLVVVRSILVVVILSLLDGLHGLEHAHGDDADEETEDDEGRENDVHEEEDRGHDGLCLGACALELRKASDDSTEVA